MSSPGPKKDQNEEMLRQKEEIFVEAKKWSLKEYKNRYSHVKRDSLKPKNEVNNAQECTKKTTNSKLQRGYTVMNFGHENFSQVAGLAFIHEEEEEKTDQLPEITRNNQSIEIVRSYSDGVIQKYSRIHDSSMY